MNRPQDVRVRTTATPSSQTRTSTCNNKTLAASTSGCGTFMWKRVGSDFNGNKDSMGSSVALSADGHRVAIGASGDLTSYGYISVHGWTGSGWAQVGSTLKGDERGDFFGQTIALSSKGNRVAVGAMGYVRIFEWTAELKEWNQVGSDLVGSTKSVALSADGNRVAICSAFRAYTYDWTGSQWSKLGSTIHVGVVEGDDNWDYTSTVALSSDGNRLAVRTLKKRSMDHWVGHVRIYNWTVGSQQWAMMGSALDAQHFSFPEGQMVALSSSGNRVAYVGAACSRKFDDGAKRTLIGIFDWRGDHWEKVGLVSSCNAGAGSEKVLAYSFRAAWTVALSSDGNRLAIAADRGCPKSQGHSWGLGHVIIYDWTGFQWIKVSPALSADDSVYGDAFSRVALSSDGTRLVIGAPYYCVDQTGRDQSGRVRIYDEVSVLQQEDPSS